MPPVSTRYRKPDPVPQLQGMGGGIKDPVKAEKIRVALDELALPIMKWIRTAVDAMTGDVRPHAETHKALGSDIVLLDELGTPTDNIRLNASTTAHGLLPKLPGGTTLFLRGDGTWVVVESAGGGDLVPLTAVLLGMPEFLWDSEHNLVMARVFDA